jgi:DNA modification methylase
MGCYVARDLETDAQSIEELEQIERDSKTQELPKQPQVFSVSKRFSKLHNLPDQTNPPLGYDSGRGYENAFPYIRLPFLHPKHKEDRISFGYGSSGYLDENKKQFPFNTIFFGDNLHVLRNLPSNTIDLIYIDPPFFSGRVYNQIWGDNNELRTFSDIWDGGLPSYLIWLNARLWEMKRLLKSTGSIYVHLDWHAVHYVKSELDKIFGYDNFKNEIVWYYSQGGKSRSHYARKHDSILWYSKGKDCYFDSKAVRLPFTPHKQSKSGGNYGGRMGIDEEGREYVEKWGTGKKKLYRYYLDEGKLPEDVWTDIQSIQSAASERIGYPTQKPEALLERIIKGASPENGVVADFYMGGGTTLAVAQKNGRKFIGCDISRVAVSVTLDRLVRDAEIMTGKTASTRIGKNPIQSKMLIEHVIPDISVYYHGIYPIDKFYQLDQDEFDTFILTCYGASKNSVVDGVTGFKKQFEPVLVGPVNPDSTLAVSDIKKFIQAVISRHVQKNQRYTLSILAWKFETGSQEYKKQLQKTIFKKLRENNVVFELEFIPIRSKQFRERVTSNFSIAEEDKDKLLKFIDAPTILEVLIKKVAGKKLTYQFEVFAKCHIQDGQLINCQWDFDYKDNNFSETQYTLGRNKIAGDGFEANLATVKKFDKPGKYTIACKVQDNFGGEAIKTIQIMVKE